MSKQLFNLFWHQLMRVDSMTFNACSKPGSQMNWNGQAQAKVEVSALSSVQENTVYLIESGHFLSQHSATTVVFNNTFKLIFQPESIAFYHERFGKNNPVWLFDLTALDRNTLINRNVHQCGQDQYSVIITLTEQSIDMHWQIIGPKKNEVLDYCYKLKTIT